MPNLSKERVLLVDDEPQMLVALEDLLSDKFTILKSNSGAEALRILDEEHDIAVVVTDQRMPSMTGDQFLARLDRSCIARRILVTGFADLNAVIRSVNEGKIFAYVTKPWDANDLHSKVDRAAEQFRATRELVNEHQLLHDLMVHSPDGIYLKDRQLRFVHANHSFALSSGNSSASTMLGKRISEHAPLNVAAEVEAEEQRVLETGTPALDVLREYPQGLTTRWFSETKAPIRRRDGNVVGLLGICRDVTDRVLGQQALAASEARLRTQTRMLHAILDNLAEGVLVADRTGKFILFNRQARKLLGAGVEELALENWTTTCGVYLLDRTTLLSTAEDPLQRATAGEPWTEMEVFIHNPRIVGSIVELTATPLATEDGSVIGGIAVMRDVTVRRALESQLAQALKMEAIGRLAAGIAHDFNNLLSVVQSCTELLLQEAAEGQQREDLHLILTASERGALLTRQLLLFSRQQPIQFETLQINDVVKQLEPMLTRILGEDVRFATQLDADVGLVRADRSQIEQILLNLAVNARDAMPRGGELTIRTQGVQLDEEQLASTPESRPGMFAVLTVSDTGVGIDTQTQEHMFEPFYTTKEVGKGTGLGLATVYGIVREAGGFVRWQSQINRGTAFDIYWPSAVNAPLRRAEQTLDMASSAANTATILLVEDEDAVRAIAARVLRAQGYRVLEARVPSEAQRLFSETTQHIDLLLTDIVMPEMSGTRLAVELCAQRPGLQVLYMSGYVGVREPSDGVWYLSKPFTTSSLLSKVFDALARKPAAKLS